MIGKIDGHLQLCTERTVRPATARQLHTNFLRLCYYRDYVLHMINSHTVPCHLVSSCIFHDDDIMIPMIRATRALPTTPRSRSALGPVRKHASKQASVTIKSMHKPVSCREHYASPLDKTGWNVEAKGRSGSFLSVFKSVSFEVLMSRRVRTIMYATHVLICTT